MPLCPHMLVQGLPLPRRRKAKLPLLLKARRRKAKLLLLPPLQPKAKRRKAKPLLPPKAKRRSDLKDQIPRFGQASLTTVDVVVIGTLSFTRASATGFADALAFLGWSWMVPSSPPIKLPEREGRSHHWMSAWTGCVCMSARSSMGQARSSSTSLMRPFTAASKMILPFSAVPFVASP